MGDWETLASIFTIQREFGIMKIDLLCSSTALNYKCILRIGYANGLKAKVLCSRSVSKRRELPNHLVRFNELLLLAPNSFEGGA
jgi:hypothetical protein